MQTTVISNRRQARNSALAVTVGALLEACLANPAAQIEYADGALTVRLKCKSGCREVVGIVNMNAPGATGVIADILRRVKG
jgi:hypothetical protein